MFMNPPVVCAPPIVRPAVVRFEPSVIGVVADVALIVVAPIVVEFKVAIVSLPCAVGYVKKLFCAVAKVK